MTFFSDNFYIAPELNDKKSIEYYHFGFNEADLQNSRKDTLPLPIEAIYFFPTENMRMVCNRNNIVDILKNAIKRIEDDAGDAEQFHDHEDQQRQSKNVNNRKKSSSPYQTLRRSERTKITSSRKRKQIN